MLTRISKLACISLVLFGATSLCMEKEDTSPLNLLGQSYVSDTYLKRAMKVALTDLVSSYIARLGLDSLQLAGLASREVNADKSGHRDKRRLLISYADHCLYGFGKKQNRLHAKEYYERALKECGMCHDDDLAYVRRVLEELKDLVPKYTPQEVSTLLETGVNHLEHEKPDYLAAVKCFEAVAQQDQFKEKQAWAFIRLGKLYLQGYPGIAKDLQRANMFLQLAYQQQVCQAARACALILLGNSCYAQEDFSGAAKHFLEIIKMKGTGLVEGPPLHRAYGIVGLMYSKGQFFDFNFATARDYLELALNQGDFDFSLDRKVIATPQPLCTVLDKQRSLIREGDRHYYGFGAKQNRSLAKEHFLSALHECADGENDAYAYAKRKLEELKNPMPPCTQEQLSALLEKGLNYLEDEKPHYLDALKCFEAVAEQNYFKGKQAWALTNLGKMYMQDYPGIATDFEKARMFLQLAKQQQASKLASARALILLADLCYMQRDFKNAGNYFAEILKLQSTGLIDNRALARAYAVLGIMLKRGQLFNPDLELAKQHFELALKHSASEPCDEEAKALAQANLGEIYLEGVKMETIPMVRNLLVSALLQGHSREARLQAGPLLLKLEEMIAYEMQGQQPQRRDQQPQEQKHVPEEQKQILKKTSSCMLQ